MNYEKINFITRLADTVMNTSHFKGISVEYAIARSLWVLNEGEFAEKPLTLDEYNKIIDNLTDN